jgi:hypothetical protein
MLGGSAPSDRLAPASAVPARPGLGDRPDMDASMFLGLLNGDEESVA